MPSDLPPINDPGNSHVPPSEVRPGGNPNEKPKTVQSPFQVFKEGLKTTITENISTRNAVRQGVYNSYGNNVITRTGIGAMDAAGKAFDRLLNGEPEEEETPTDKLLKKLVETEEHSNELLDKILHAQGLSGQKEEGENVSDAISKMTESLLKAMTDNKDEILSKIHTDITDLSTSMKEGFESLREKMTDVVHGREKKRKNKDEYFWGVKTLDNDPSPTLEFPEKESKKESNSLIEIYKFTEHISKNTDAIIAILRNGYPHGVQDKIGMSEKPNEKFMGNVEEVPKEEQIKKGLSSVIDTFSSFKKKMGGVFSNIGKTFGNIIKSLGGFGKTFGNIIKSLGGFGKTIASKLGGFFSKSAPEKSNMNTVGESSNAMDELIPKEGEPSGIGLGDSLLDAGKAVVGGGLMKKIAGIGLKGVLGGAAKATGILAAGMVAYDGISGAMNADEILDKDKDEVNWKDRLAAGAGKAVGGLTFGLVDDKKAAKWLDSFVSDKPKEDVEKLKKEKELSDSDKKKSEPVAPAPAAGAPSVSVNNSSNSYYSFRKDPRNGDESFNRYLDNHYAFK